MLDSGPTMKTLTISPAIILLMNMPPSFVLPTYAGFGVGGQNSFKAKAGNILTNDE